MVVSLPDPDGSEIVQWIDVAGVPSGWTLSDTGATVVFDGFAWEVIAGNVAHGGEIDLSLTPPANFVGTQALTVTAHVVDAGNGSQNQSIPVTLNVTVTAVTPEPGSTRPTWSCATATTATTRSMISATMPFLLRPPGSGRHGVASCRSRWFLWHRRLGHDPARQLTASSKSTTSATMPSPMPPTGPSRFGMAGCGLRRFLARRRDRHADAEQQ